MCVLYKIFKFLINLNIKKQTQKQPYAVDHLARESMKSAANCVN